MKGCLRGLKSLLPLGLCHELLLEAHEQNRGGDFRDLFNQGAGNCRLGHVQPVGIDLSEVHAAKCQAAVDLSRAPLPLRGPRRNRDNPNRVRDPGVFKEGPERCSFVLGTKHNSLEGRTIDLLKGLGHRVVLNNRGIPVIPPELPIVRRGILTLSANRDPSRLLRRGRRLCTLGCGRGAFAFTFGRFTGAPGARTVVGTRRPVRTGCLCTFALAFGHRRRDCHWRGPL